MRNEKKNFFNFFLKKKTGGGRREETIKCTYKATKRNTVAEKSLILIFLPN